MHLWQNVVALTLVLAAAMYVAVYLLRASRRRKSSGCAACPACAATVQQPSLVRIEPSEKPGSPGRSG
jgi:hypothetical protein